MSTRVYLPLTRQALRALVSDSRLGGPIVAHAVTDALRDAWSEADDEECEYAALAAAARESWQFRDEGDSPRRLVIAADVTTLELREVPGEPTAVRVIGDLEWKQVAAAHIDTEDQPRDAVGDGLGELAWFATQEIAGLL